MNFLEKYKSLNDKINFLKSFDLINLQKAGKIGNISSKKMEKKSDAINAIIEYDKKNKFLICKTIYKNPSEYSKEKQDNNTKILNVKNKPTKEEKIVENKKEDKEQINKLVLKQKEDFNSIIEKQQQYIKNQNNDFDKKLSDLNKKINAFSNSEGFDEKISKILETQKDMFQSFIEQQQIIIKSKDETIQKQFEILNNQSKVFNEQVMMLLSRQTEVERKFPTRTLEIPTNTRTLNLNTGIKTLNLRTKTNTLELNKIRSLDRELEIIRARNDQIKRAIEIERRRREKNRAERLKNIISK